jgi:hypothetical protein
MILQCPDLTESRPVDMEVLEKLRVLVRESSTDQRIQAHRKRLRRSGDKVVSCIQEALSVVVKHQPYGRIFLLGTCPICERSERTAHINENGWRLKCKRESCRAIDGVSFEEWSKNLGLDVRSKLRALIAEDRALSRMEANPPPRMPGEPDYRVSGYEEGSKVIAEDLVRFHAEGLELKRSSGREVRRVLFVGAGCGTGKTLAATRIASSIPIAYSTLQYSLLDEFKGGRPYQVQGVHKGCTVDGLGAVAAARGVSRSFLCHRAGKECSSLAICLAQPRIESGGTPCFVTPALPSVAFGAVVKDGTLLPKAERGEPIAPGRLVVIDEAPTPFEEVICTANQVAKAQAEGVFSNQSSRARGLPHTEAGDAVIRLSFLEEFLNRASRSSRRPNGASFHNGGALTKEETARELEFVLRELAEEDEWKDARSLFRLEMVPDLTKPSGERPCIPEQSDWTVYEMPLGHQDPQQVRKLVPRAVIDTCRSIARALDGNDSSDHKLVFSSAHGGQLITLRRRELWLPGATGTVIMTAGLAVHARLFRALNPSVETRVLWIELVPQSKVSRVLFLSSAFLRTRSQTAFAAEAESGAERQKGVNAHRTEGSRRSKAQTDFLGSLARVLRETASRAVDAQARGELPQGPLRTLIVAQQEVVAWLADTADGKSWLQQHLPAPLSVQAGNPWDPDPDQWGDIVYFGGRGRGENLWKDCRVAITVGDPLPTPDDMEIRWGDVLDPVAGEPFDPVQVGVWLAQEAVMQAHGRTRPGREGLPTLLVHAGRYLPMGFEESDEVVHMEGTRAAAFAARSNERVREALATLERPGAAGAGRVSVTEVARLAGVDRKTALKYWRDETSVTMRELAARARVWGICHLSIKGGNPELACLQEASLGLLREARSRGTSLPKAATARALLAQIEGAHMPALRTVQDHLRKIRRDLEGVAALDIPKRRDTSEARAAALLAALVHAGCKGATSELPGDRGGWEGGVADARS